MRGKAFKYEREKTMKKFIIGLAALTTFSAQAATNCEEHDVRAKVKSSIKALVGQNAGANDNILKVENINVLTTEDETGNVKALYSFDETIGLNAEMSAVFKMLGYAKFKKTGCKKVDAVTLGSTPAP